MDINSLSAQFLNSSHIPFSASMSAAGLPSAGLPAPTMPGVAGVNSVNDFEALLRRTQSARAVDAPSSPASGLPAIVQDKKLYELCLELETFMVKNLISSMRSTVNKTNLIDTGLAGEIYEDMLFDEYAKVLTRNAGFGFAEMAYRELSTQTR